MEISVENIFRRLFAGHTDDCSTNITESCLTNNVIKKLTEAWLKSEVILLKESKNFLFLF